MGRETGGTTGVGQLRISGVLASEPAGKPLRDSAHGECVVTYDAGDADDEVQRRHGLVGLRRHKLVRIATEAHEQGIDLTQEALARILGAGLLTIRRDIAGLRARGVYVPTRGQQKDLGPIVPHQVEAVRLVLEGHPPAEVSRRILRPPAAVTRILGGYRRVTSLLARGRDPHEIADLVGVPRRLVLEYRRLADEHARRRPGKSALVPAAEAPPAKAGRAAGAPVSRRAPGRPPIFEDRAEVLRPDIFQYVLELELGKASRYRLPLSLVVIEPARPRQRPASASSVAMERLAELLRSALRRTDVIGRSRIDRYVVLLPLADAPTARGALDRLRDARSGRPGHEFVAGAACFPAHGSQLAELLHAGERALAAARAEGRPYVLRLAPGE